MSNPSAPSRLKVGGVICFYIAASLVMVFVNKAVLNAAPDLPFTFLFIQLVLAVILLHVSAFLTTTPLKIIFPGKIELPELNLKTALSLMPLVAVGVTGLIFNTLCLAKVDTSFFQIARGLLLPFTIVASAIQTHKSPRLPVIIAALTVTVGFFLGAAPSSYFGAKPVTEATFVSLAYGCISSLMLAVHAILIKSAHTYVDNSSIKLTYWGNLLSAILLIPCIVMNGEVTPLMVRFARADREWVVFVYGTAITGLFGFFMGLSTLLSIKVTSPVTHMFSSAARSAIQTVLGAYIFSEIITTNRAGSIFIITLGAIYYTWIQSQRPPPPILPPSPNTDVEKQRPL